jgi:hypothetical protein
MRVSTWVAAALLREFATTMVLAQLLRLASRSQLAHDMFATAGTEMDLLRA